MEPAVLLERPADSRPVETRLPGDIAEGENHALLHRLEAADVEIRVRIGEQRRKVGRAFAHQVLHVKLGLAGRAAESEVDVDEVLGQTSERSEIRQLLLGSRAEE